MGETRVKKAKKNSKPTDQVSKNVDQSLKKLSLDNTLESRQQARSEKSTSSHTTVQTTSLSSGDDEDDDRESNFHFDSTYIEVRQTEHKGQAVFAARKIPAGALILAETPLVRLTQQEEDNDETGTSTDEDVEGASTLDTRFSLLPKSSQKMFLSLHDSEKATFGRVKSIYYSNCYNLSGPNRPSSLSPGGSCIGPLASRINHSCVSNVQFSFDEAHGLMLFHAIRSIPRGREVLSTYDSVFLNRSARQRRLVLFYNFTCDCEACVPPAGSEFWHRSDERRAAMLEARHEIKALKERKDGPDAEAILVLLLRLEALLVKEGLTGLPLANTYRDLAKWTAAAAAAAAKTPATRSDYSPPFLLEKEQQTEKEYHWRRRELETCVTCLGRQSPRVKELRARIG